MSKRGKRQFLQDKTEWGKGRGVKYVYVIRIPLHRLIMMGPTQPMNIFLNQEIDRIQKVIELVKNSLEDLLLAIDGIIIMNEVNVLY